LTVVSGTSASLTDGAATFVPGQHVGWVVTFAGNVTAALVDHEEVVVSNSDRTLTFTAGNLPGTPAAGDTYTLRCPSADRAISDLREGKSLADSPAGSVYGDYRSFMDGVLSVVQQISMTPATGTLTLTVNAGDTNTVTIGSKVYTFQTVLTNVDGNVLIGASASDSIDNLIDAINLGAGGGTDYAAATTIHPTVRAAAGAGDTMVVTVKSAAYFGALGNAIATSDTLAGASAWGGATLAGGAMGSLTQRSMGHASLACAAGSTASVVQINTMGSPFRIDELRGRTVTISSESRRVVSNDEDSMTLDMPLSSAPSAATAIAVYASDAAVDYSAYPVGRVHPGGQPGENVYLSDVISRFQAAVVAYTLPT
jgi:hypothetical protein